jgi:hypothetical protein
MATSTTTIRRTQTTCVACGSDGDGPGGLFSFEEIYRSYLECRKNKRNTVNALAFEAALFDNLHRLREELAAGTYRPSRSICFVARQPKLREIFAADFRDRVVHHLLVRRLEPRFDVRFVHDSFACRRGKGTHAAVDRLQRFARRVTRNGTLHGRYLQLDIKGFFIAIDKEILCRILLRRVPEETLRRLSRAVISHDPTENYLFKGDRRLLERIPSHKSLFCTGNRTGLAIGNLTSQFFANVYLDRLDQFVKHELKVRYYVRYVDDLVLLDETGRSFPEWEERIGRFLGENLRLSLNHRRTRTGRVAGGIDFLGYIVRPHYRLARRRTVNNFKARLRAFEKELVEDGPAGTVYLFPEERLEALLAVLNAYFAHFAHASSHRLKGRVLERFSFLGVYFAYEGGKVTRRYPRGAGFRDYPSQVSAIRRCFRHAVCFVRIGRYYELYDEDAVFGAERLGLKLQKPRRGFRLRCGFHRSMLGRYTARALGTGRPVVIVEEERESIGGVRIRRPARMIRPAACDSLV